MKRKYKSYRTSHGRQQGIMDKEERKYLQLLAEKYPSIQSVCREIINLNAILNLPKGTEHFMSDLHGEYEAFCHILNNCSGVIREKVNRLFGESLSDMERQEICTLIYYPKEKLELIKKQQDMTADWYYMILNELLEIAKLLSSKYTRSKVRKAMPQDFSYIIDELLHVQKDEDDNQVRYHREILETIIRTESADEFIIALAVLIKRLAVDHLHIVGDIFDRGSCPDKILDLLMNHHSLDIEWGNHDILWMGAVAGSDACIANVIRNNIKFNNMTVLENGYGISLRNLVLFAEKTYQHETPMEAALKAITVMLFKVEAAVIDRHPEYKMNHRKLLHQINYDKGTITLEGKEYPLNDTDFPTINPDSPYELTNEEVEIMERLKSNFRNSKRLKMHIEFLYEKGSMYKCYNDNLLYHGCVPLDEEGNFEGVTIAGKTYKGKSYFDYAEKVARRAYFDGHRLDDIDFMWYLWCGEKSPLFGRQIKTFERAYLSDKEAWAEETNNYYKFYHKENICHMILREFELYSPTSHIINGHTPVKTGEGEQPIRANGKLIVIDGGLCKEYHKTTGIAGYTLIYNSHGLRLKAHQPFESVYKALRENKDIESSSQMVETEKMRVMVKQTDNGKKLQEDIDDLERLLRAYREGKIEYTHSMA